MTVKNVRNGIGLLLIVLGMIIAVHFVSKNASQNLIDSQIAACHRGNDLRASLQEERRITAEFLATASQARAKAYEVSGQKFDKDASEQYDRQANQLSAPSTFAALNPVDCDRIVEDPEDVDAGG